MTEKPEMGVSETFDENTDAGAQEPEPGAAETAKPKAGVLARFRSFLAGRKEQKTATKKNAVADTRQINEFLGVIEAQLDKVDGQNKSLLEQLSMLKINNETLVSQVKILTQNNNQLTEQFNAMKKREKVAKILAIISAILAISLSVFNIGRAFFQWW